MTFYFGVDVQRVLVFFTLIVLSCGSTAFGQAERVQNFAQWKKQQVTEAENRTVRLSNRITNIKSTTGNLNEILKLENELKGAFQYSEVVKDLTIEDYFNVYLSHYADSPKAIETVAKSLSKTDVAELLKIFLKRHGESAALESSSGILTGLAQQPNNPNTTF
jgi:hypothetical protein